MKPGGIGSSTTKTAQDIAKTIAKQAAQEPLEILKDAGAQITGAETGKPQENQSLSNENRQNQADTRQQQMKDQAFSQRRMQALQNEVDDIRKQETFKNLQEKITNGETVALEDFPELSMEQRQVLKAQMEAVKFRQQQAAYQSSVQEVPTVHSKPSRRFGAGQKHEAEKAQTRVEKPVPPSG